MTLTAHPHHLYFLLAFSFAVFHSVSANDPDKVTIIDERHYSNVFGEVRNYRVFLPPGYSENPSKRYPVIYFYHGWSQRYFGSSNPYGDFDEGDDNGGDNIANFVSRNEVIVVKPDGYNRSPDEPYYVRPYNVSPVETYRQFPLYFPELVAHIDAQYRTIADREHRAISGLSMGGFMTFWIGGKYPHLLSAAGNFCGSPEFTVGPKDFPAEFRHLDMYNNYGGMNVRLHYGDKDFIRGYHQDLNKVWTQVMDNYDYKVFDAAHSTCGMGEMFSFIMDTFKNPPARPAKWAHTDVYPAFTVWDYNVTTDRTVPGFTVMEKVDTRGFRISVREFLPDGEVLSDVDVSIRTPPIYVPHEEYVIHDIDINTGQTNRRTLRSDGSGRLTLQMNGSVHEVGINKKNDATNISLAGVALSSDGWAKTGQDVSVSITILNKGQSAARNVRATVSAIRPSARIRKGDISFGDIAVNAQKKGNEPLVFRVDTDTIAIEKFKVTVRDDRKNEWVEHFEITLNNRASEIQQFEIADGRVVTVTKSGTDTTTTKLGTGNGDGIANPGESIVVLIKDQDKLWRANLTGTDPYINPFGVRNRKSDNWTSFDHVGGSAKYDVPLIASDIPDGHTITFLAEYWLPEYPIHHIRKGVVKIPVRGKDTTPPVCGRVKVTGDNVLHARIFDGGRITRVKATLVNKDDPKKSLEVSLNDEGTNGDRTANNLVFSARVPDQVFGIFRVTLEAEDVFGNVVKEEIGEEFVVH